MQEHRVLAAFDSYFSTSLVKYLNAAQNSFATERNHVNYSNLLEIIRDKQEQQADIPADCYCSELLPMRTSPSYDAALARLDAEFKAYSARFKGGR